MPNEGRTPHAHTRNRQHADFDSGPSTHACARCGGPIESDRVVCRGCTAVHRRQRPPRMSRRTKVVRRLVPTLLVLIGGVAGGVALASRPPENSGRASLARATAPVRTKTVRQTVIQPVSTRSDTHIDAQQTTTDISVAQIAAAMASSGDQYFAAPDSSDDDGGDVSSDPPSDQSEPADNMTTGGSDPTGGLTEVRGPTVETTPGGSSADDADGDDCSDSYDGACVAPYTGEDDVNCDDVTETDFDSVADDPYELDADGDGTACESY
jgi:predicted nucleic acid-binding Zn ribbon protein